MIFELSWFYCSRPTSGDPNGVSKSHESSLGKTAMSHDFVTNKCPLSFFGKRHVG